jgi:hypothetical protein
MKRHVIKSPKFKLIIAWNVLEFYAIDVFPNEQKFHAGYYLSVVLEPLMAWCQAETTERDQKLIVDARQRKVHIAKVTLRFFKKNAPKSAPHPLIYRILYCLTSFFGQC